MIEKIQARYKKYSNQNLGCANLSQYWQIKKGDTILDIGCGRGKTAISLAEKVGKNGRVTGIDATPEMISEASGLPANVSLIEGDMHTLPFGEETFDIVISNCVINHSKRKDLVFSQINKVLKKGGYFLIGDVMAVNELPCKVSNDPDKIAACWGGAIPRDQYMEMVNQAGFDKLEVLNSRQYEKEGYLLESIVLKGVK